MHTKYSKQITLFDSKKKIVIFDGHFLLFKYFFGMPRTIFSKEGRPIHGALGFIASVIQQIKKFDPSNVIVCFDTQGDTKKEQIDNHYKGNRIKSFEIGSDDNPFSQFGVIQASLEYLGIPFVLMPGYEADDVIGTIAKWATVNDFEVIISSGDTDFLQLVDDNISVYKKSGKKEVIYDPETIRESYGVEPKQIIAYKALSGDKSDNIIGVPGVGPKTCSVLLSKFDNILTVFSCLEELNPSLSIKLTKYKDRILKNEKLITIETSIDIEIPETKLSISFEKLSAKNVLQAIGVW